MVNFLNRLSFSILALVVVSFIPISCSNELDVNADWKEIGIVYCLLNESDSIHYVKVNKAYLNEGVSALDVAKIEDSLFFDDQSLKVELGYNRQFVTLVRTKIENKQDGVFAAPESYVYQTPNNYILDQSRTYILKLTNEKSTYSLQAQTNLVRNGTILDPFINTNQINLVRCTFDGRTYFIKRTMKIAAGRGAKFYDLDIIFNYSEWNLNSQDTVRHNLTWSRGRLLSTNSISGGQEISAAYDGEDFFNYLASQLTPANGQLERKIGKITFRYSAGGQEIFDYINVNRPSVGIVQKKPEYTNVENGLGIFSSKNVQELELILDDCTKDHLRESEITSRLGFVR